MKLARVYNIVCGFWVIRGFEEADLFDDIWRGISYIPGIGFRRWIG